MTETPCSVDCDGTDPAESVTYPQMTHLYSFQTGFHNLLCCPSCACCHCVPRTFPLYDSNPQEFSHHAGVMHAMMLSVFATAARPSPSAGGLRRSTVQRPVTRRPLRAAASLSLGQRLRGLLRHKRRHTPGHGTTVTQQHWHWSETADMPGRSRRTTEGPQAEGRL